LFPSHGNVKNVKGVCKTFRELEKRVLHRGEGKEKYPLPPRETV